MDIYEFIRPELTVLIPVLYLLGIGLKRSRVPDRLIPTILGAVSVVVCAFWVIATGDVDDVRSAASALFVSITQGILAAGASVYINQLYVQSKKEE